MTRWEYLGVGTQTVTKQGADNTWTYVTTWIVTTRGKTVARLRTTVPVDQPVDEYKQLPIGEQHPDYALRDDERMWDHLGEMGWEMVTGYVRASMLRQDDGPGWFTTSSAPFQEFFAFKRPLSD